MAMLSLESLLNRPNFFIVGAQKAGTTRLHYLLGLHPDVFTSHIKEPEVFDREPFRANRVEQYLKLFEDVGGAKAIGESSTAYSRCQRLPGTARRIFEFNPEAKIIYIVRHPLRRMESSWIQSRVDYRITPANFNRAVREDTLDLLDATLYWKQLSQYRQYFREQQILVLFFEQFIQDEAATLRRCFKFLGVDPAVVVDCSGREKQNLSLGKPHVSQLLRTLYSSPIAHRVCVRMPRRLKEKGRQLLISEFTAKPVWDKATWQWALTQLEDDTRRFLASAGKPSDFWNLEFPG